MHDKGFRLKILATGWGFEGSQTEFFAKASGEGYDGIETWFPADERGRAELAELLARHKLEVGFLCGSQHTSYEEHFSEFKEMVDAAAHCIQPAPLYINCHSGRDYFSFEQNKTFIDHTINLSARTGIKICHETHRSRILFAAPCARKYFDEMRDLRITFDLSHWCNVSESLLAEQPVTVAIAIERADHIHARIGHPEGPQVNDPRAPEWKTAVDAHLSWWDRIVDRKKTNGELLTILTEFGPPDYLPTEPYSRRPLADQWEVNVYMKDLLKDRYG